MLIAQKNSLTYRALKHGRIKYSYSVEVLQQTCMKCRQYKRCHKCYHLTELNCKRKYKSNKLGLGHKRKYV